MYELREHRHILNQVLADSSTLCDIFQSLHEIGIHFFHRLRGGNGSPFFEKSLNKRQLVKTISL